MNLNELLEGVLADLSNEALKWALDQLKAQFSGLNVDAGIVITEVTPLIAVLAKHDGALSPDDRVQIQITINQIVTRVKGGL